MRTTVHKASADTELPFAPGDPVTATATGGAAVPAGRSTPPAPRPSVPASDSAAYPGSPGRGAGSERVPGTATPPGTAPSGTPSQGRPASAWKSLRSVNHPDRYWHLSDGYVRLDQVSAESPARFLRHRDFRLRLERYDDSGLFRADAAFRVVDGWR